MLGAFHEALDKSLEKLGIVISGRSFVTTAHHLKGICEGSVGGRDVLGERKRVDILRLTCPGGVDDVKGAEEGGEVGTTTGLGLGLFFFDAVFDCAPRWSALPREMRGCK
jgi:hypothetical protein